MLSWLRVAYRDAGTGGIRYRCSAEPLDQYARKGGKREQGLQSRCLCNGLLSTVGLAISSRELPIVTMGDRTDFLAHLPNPYAAADAIAYLLGPVGRN